MAFPINKDDFARVCSFMTRDDLVAVNQTGKPIHFMLLAQPRPALPSALKLKMESKGHITTYKEYKMWKASCAFFHDQPPLGIEHLDLSHSKLNDGELALILADFPNLKKINLSHCSNLTDQALGHLARRCPALESVDLFFNSAITDLGITYLSHCSNLERVNINWCYKVGDAGIDQLSRNCPRLKYLDVSNCSRITDDGAESLSRFENLESISISHGYFFTDVGLERLCRCPNLASVNLTWCTRITDEGLRPLSRCPKLQSVDLSSCAEITQAGLDLFNGHPTLRALQHTVA